MIDRNFILNELSYYKEYDMNILETLEDDKLVSFFNNHCDKYSEYVEAKNLVDNYKDTSFLMETPDGYSFVGDFWIKKNKEIYTIKTSGGFKINASMDHLVQTPDGWKKLGEITKKDSILTKNGYEKVKHILKWKNIEDTYDWEILTDSHRYWAGNGICSHNTGKTYLILNACKQAQDQGYYIVYYDSENAVDKALLSKFKIDMTKFRYEPVNTVQEFRSNITAMLDTLIENKEKGFKIPKIMVCLDSAGNLATQKEIEDAKSKEDKADMTRAKLLKSTFRILMTKMALCHVNFIFSNHSYSSQSFIPTQVAGGGTGPEYAASIILFLSKAKLKEGAEQTGIVVTAKANKNRFCKPKTVKFHISYNKGMNPYVGLEEYISWENCGVERGKFLNEKEYERLSASDKKLCYKDEWEDEEGKHIQYFQPSSTGRQICCEHLHSGVKLERLFTPEVFSQEVLNRLAPIIHEDFAFDVEGEESDLNTFIEEDGEED